MTPPPLGTASVTHRYGCSPERAFDAWLEPALIGRWMFGPALRDEEILRIAIDARVGGAFSFLVRRAGTDIDHVGEYVEIDRPRRIVFTWSVPHYSSETTRVTVEIAPFGTGCELTLTHVLPAEFAQRASEAWGMMLGVLGSVLGEASNPSV